MNPELAAGGYLSLRADILLESREASQDIGSHPYEIA